MVVVPPAFSDAIRDRYVVERELGAGGMANVYLARDLRHRRRVAIKVLKPALAASVGVERFLKEIEIAARLTHPHIIPLHDSGAAAGFLYYVMPFIDGESLRGRLRRETRLDPTEALDIAQGVGEALSYAHRQGVLHRDIKPENILFAEGHPMVADFGIARALTTAGDTKLTGTGLAIGTPGYMSPEQAMGERDLDARSDEYSLACVVYEMLLGEVPKMGQGMDARLRQIGRPIEQALARALALRPDDRFPTVDAFLVALHARGAPARRYRDDEVEEIVRRAADDQVAHPTTAAGMSLRTVQEIAGDVGISPDRVARAAQRLDAAPGPGSVWLGAPTRLAVERVVEGTVPESTYAAIVAEVQGTFATHGQVETIAGSLTWRAEKPVLGKRRAAQVRVTSRGGRTKIQVQERLGELATSLYGGIVLGGGVGGVATILAIWGGLGHVSQAGLLSVAWFGGMVAIARTIYRGVAHHRRLDLEELSERIDEIASGSDD